MIEVRKTSEFANWFKRLKDVRARARIQVRIDRVELGNLGDAKFFDGSASFASTTVPATASTS